ncbi:TRNA binding domain containing protein [Trichomonas vaginalis G3]|uniref:tRNA binding domain containing protein n=1 Tax=Trichomonas vaginalis (strain ATCC PRA-98 / G3) TaxID=412133 RepID=A2F4T2_TRIV3|nr:tRNA binding [Trichomonas vaginalis G3]EAY00095.1 TRNA binding domain containing protein [Trichomonas vaginalis G3]KAI5547151.1 tRNA binding [Trichomonas vaginalis G3]|eukprot:XP_001313024.1 TRNA binding domain containing protein [Trichomonas vaginalis G3]
MSQVRIPAEFKRRSTIEAVAAWCDTKVEFVEDASLAQPQLTIGGINAIGVPAIASILVRNSKVAENFNVVALGDGNAKDAALIAQYVDFAEAAATETSGQPMQGTVGSISLHLKGRHFVATDKLSVADILMYCAVYDYVSKMPNKEQTALGDICRWFDSVQKAFKTPLPVVELKVQQHHEKKPQNKGEHPQNQEKKEKKEKKPKEPKPAKAPEAPKETFDSASYLDIRVGKIVKIEPHPGADTLYSEEIDIGNGEIKKVITGVRNYVPIEQMQDRHVVVFCNIKPSKIRGLPSEGMVFAASNADHTVVQLLDPPADTPIGTRVLFGDFCKTEPVACDKKGNLWKDCCEHCTIDADGFACYKGQHLTVPQGKITVPTLRSCEFH